MVDLSRFEFWTSLILDTYDCYNKKNQYILDRFHKAKSLTHDQHFVHFVSINLRIKRPNFNFQYQKLTQYKVVLRVSTSVRYGLVESAANS